MHIDELPIAMVVFFLVPTILSFRRRKELERMADGSEKISGTPGTAQNFPESKAAEESLRESEKRYHDLFENMLNGCALHEIVTDERGRPVDYVFLEVNRAFTDLTGLSPQQVIGRRMTELFPVGEASRLIEIYGKVALGGESVRFEESFEPLGRTFEISAFSPERGRFASIFSDITERKEAEKALRESEEQFRALVKNAPDAIFIQDRGCFAYVNEAALRLYGATSEEELLGRPIMDRVHPDSRAEVLERIRTVNDEKKPCPLSEHKYIKLDGTAIDVETRGVPVAYRKGEGGLVFVRDITERKRAEDALRESEERFRTVVENSEAGYFFIDRDGRYRSVNDAWMRMHGYTSPEEVIGRHFRLTQAEPELHQAQAVVDRILSGHTIRSGEFSRHCKDGSVGYHTFSANPVVKRGEIVGLEGFLIDITERKRAEEALREGEHRFRSIFDSMREMVVLHELIYDSEGRPVDYRIIECNPAFSYCTGIAHERAVGALASQVYETGEPPYLESYAHVAQTGNPAQFESYFAPMQKYFQISVVSAGQGRFVTVSMDITERVQQQREIKLLSRLYSVLSQVSQAVVRATSPEEFLEQACRVVVEEGGFLLSWIGCVEAATNRVVPVALWGEATGYVRGISVYADDRPEGRGPAGRCIRERRHFVENDFFRNQSTLPWHERAARFGIKAAAAFPIESEGRVWGALTIYSDEINFFGDKHIKLLEKVADGIGFGLDSLVREHQRRRAEETLRQSEDRYRRLFEDSVLGIFQSTTEGKFLRVNPAYAQMFGYGSPEEMVRAVNDVAAELYVDPSRRQGIVKTIVEADVPVRVENRYVRKDGSIFIGNLHAWAVRDQDGGLAYLEGFIEDITERKRAEEVKDKLEAQLRQAQKLEAMGTLAGGIAHDFNNILAPIIGYTEMVLADTPSHSPVSHDLEQVLKASYRARDLVKQILAFSRHQQEQKRVPIDISSIIKEALKLMRASVPTSIEIRQSIDKAVALADVTQVHQVVLNLCTNATHAMDEKGVLGVALSSVELSGDDLSSPSMMDLKPGPYVKLSVSDTGHGMDAETMQRIFDPYFTTKEVGKGSGLGLAVVHGIVKRHEGAICVRSEPGKGSTFDVYLPRIEKIREALTDTASAIPGGTERVLLVDDEQMVADLEAMMLGRLGYRVTARTSPLEALELLRSGQYEPDLIITDYTMPYLTGTELASEILKIRPDMPIILCTGYSEKVTEAAAREIGIKGFAMKPLDRRQLAELIRRVLDERGEGKWRARRKQPDT